MILDIHRVTSVPRYLVALRVMKLLYFQACFITVPAACLHIIAALEEPILMKFGI
jgi:hypothetical protein